jgi:plastocyanin
MRLGRTIAAAWVSVLLLIACGGADGGPTDSDASVVPSSITPASPSSSSSQEPLSPQLRVKAPAGSTLSGFDPTELVAPADEALRIEFVNDDDGIPHNVQIFAGTSTTGTPLWAPVGNELITGVATVTYDVPALSAGTYAFNCYAHPATMVGTLQVS